MHCFFHQQNALQAVARLDASNSLRTQRRCREVVRAATAQVCRIAKRSRRRTSAVLAENSSRRCMFRCTVNLVHVRHCVRSWLRAVMQAVR